MGVCPYYNARDSRRPEIYSYEMGPVFVGGAGAEFSVVLPFNKDRWEILLNPVLYGYRKTQEYYYDNHRSDAVASELYLEIYAALRYGFDLGDKFRVFANAGFAFDVGVKSWMHYYPMGEVGTGNCGIPVFGIGCCYNRKFNAEIRYGSPKDQIDHTKFWYTESPRIELMLGYLFGNK